jgi:Dolichyl-phosphate-mannose-protein mannosyltransferase
MSRGRLALWIFAIVLLGGQIAALTPMPVWLIAAGVVVAVAALVARTPLAAAVRETGEALRRHVRHAGPVHMLALGAVIAIGVKLRLDYYDVPMRWDESFTFVEYVALRNLHQGLALYDYPNNHVFNTLLMHASYSLFGDSVRALRLPVFAAGVLLIPVTYLAALRPWGRHAALIAAALVAASAQLVEYATNARGYEIETLAAMLLLAVAPQLLRSGNPVYWGLFSLVAALGFYSVPVFAYPFGVIVVALFVAALLGQSALPLKRFLLALAASVVAALAFAALLYGPILGDVLRYTNEGGNYSNDPLGIARQVWHLWTLGIPRAARIVLVCGFAVSLAGVVLRRRSPFPLALSLAAIVGGVIAANRVVGFTRVWLALLPLFIVAAVGGLLGWAPVRRVLSARVPDLAVSAAAVAIAVPLALTIKHQQLANVDSSSLPSADAIVSFVAPRLHSGDVLVVDGTAWPIEVSAFVRHNLSPWLVVGSIPTAATGNVYLVVNEGMGESLATAIANSGGSPDVWSGSEKLAQFPGASVYELQRVAA